MRYHQNSTLCRALTPRWRDTQCGSSLFRAGTRSSVQSNSSAGSRRSPSPSADGVAHLIFRHPCCVHFKGPNIQTCVRNQESEPLAVKFPVLLYDSPCAATAGQGRSLACQVTRSGDASSRKTAGQPTEACRTARLQSSQVRAVGLQAFVHTHCRTLL